VPTTATQTKPIKYRTEDMTLEEIYALSAQEDQSWQGDLKRLVTGDVPGFRVEVSSEGFDLSEDADLDELRSRTHAIYNAIKYHLRKSAEASGAEDFRDFVEIARKGTKVMVWRRHRSDGTLVPLPKGFKTWIDADPFRVNYQDPGGQPDQIPTVSRTYDDEDVAQLRGRARNTKGDQGEPAGA
jgi:hypothetical protein